MLHFSSFCVYIYENKIYAYKGMNKMNDFKRNNTAYEHYLEASAELFMQQYAKTIPIQTLSEEPVPVQLQEKCKHVIKTENRRRNRRTLLRSTHRFAKGAAIFLVACLALSSVLFVSVEAVRTPIISFYTKQEDGNMLISGNADDLDFNDTTPVMTFNESDPLAGYLPEDFSLAELTGSMDGLGLNATYYNADMTHYITFSCINTDALISIDTDDCKVTEFELGGEKAIMSVDLENNYVILVWKNAHINKMLSLTATCLTEEKVFLMADALNDALNLQY